MELQRILCFGLARQIFALPLSLVQVVVDLCPITRVFHTPACVAGVINLRGRIVAVLDAALLMGLGRTSQSRTTRLIVVGSRSLDAAILAESIHGIRELAKSPSAVDVAIGALGEYVTGIHHAPEGPVVLLDPERILGAESLKTLR